VRRNPSLPSELFDVLAGPLIKLRSHPSFDVEGTWEVVSAQLLDAVWPSDLCNERKLARKVDVDVGAERSEDRGDLSGLRMLEFEGIECEPLRC
jgi:hypothetical protein